MKKLNSIWFFVLMLLAYVSCDKGDQYSDLDKILNSDTMRVVTLSRSTSYFDFQGTEMGYEYEVAQYIAKQLGVQLNVITAKDVDEMVQFLNNGQVDIIAYPVTITNETKDILDFVENETRTKQVVIQKKNKSKKPIVKEAIDLIGKEVCVVENSKYHMHLKQVDDEIGGGIFIETVSNDENEESLIQKVSTGEIDYTIVDDNLAALNKTYYKNIDISTEISHTQRSAWAIRKGSKDLRDTLNDFFVELQGNFVLQYLHIKYFEQDKKCSKDYPLYINNKKISKYDNLFKKYASIVNWDWKMLAAISYQESRFNPTAKSWVGAMGLMQLMPKTALNYGVDSTDIWDPEKNVRAAAKYLSKVDNIFKYMENDEERTKFVLASYNAGVGHVLDAMALAEKYGKNPEKWSDVRVFIKNKAKPEFFNDPVVRHGYLRGEEVDNFVMEIFLRYRQYNDVIID